MDRLHDRHLHSLPLRELASAARGRHPFRDRLLSRESLLEWVNGYDQEGLTKQVTFDETGEVAEVVIYAYTVTDGTIVEETEIAVD